MFVQSRNMSKKSFKYFIYSRIHVISTITTNPFPCAHGIANFIPSPCTWAITHATTVCNHHRALNQLPDFSIHSTTFVPRICAYMYMCLDVNVPRICA